MRVVGKDGAGGGRGRGEINELELRLGCWIGNEVISPAW